jgi:hypothetical protein
MRHITTAATLFSSGGYVYAPGEAVWVEELGRLANQRVVIRTNSVFRRFGGQHSAMMLRIDQIVTRDCNYRSKRMILLVDSPNVRKNLFCSPITSARAHLTIVTAIRAMG